MKGDRVEIVVDAGDTAGRTRWWRAGRAARVETAVRGGVVGVSEVTRHGSVVRTARFMATGSALVEQPVPREDSSPAAPPPGRPRGLARLHPGEYARGRRHPPGGPSIGTTGMTPARRPRA